jgi:hypothetical protein
VARVLANLRRAERGREEPCVELHGLVIDLAARAVSRVGARSISRRSSSSSSRS